MRLSLFYFMTFFLLISAVSSAQFTNGAILDVEPDEVEGGVTTTIELEVRNDGVAAAFQIELVENTNTWNVSNINPQQFFLSNGDIQTITFDLETNTANQFGFVEFRLLAEDLEGIQGFIEVDQKRLEIESIVRPADFRIRLPVDDSSISGETLVDWLRSNNADTYAIFIWQRIGDEIIGQPVIEETEIEDTQFIFDTSALQKGLDYAITVYAVNRVAEVEAENGPIHVSVPAAEPPTPFSLQAPLPEEETSDTPTFAWSESLNVDSYTVFVFSEEDGEPSDSPIREFSGIEQTFFSWEGDPLEGGFFYYVSVRAFGEGGAVTHTGAPTRFFASGLEDFALISPANAVNQSRTPVYRWAAAPGADLYELEVFDTNGKRFLNAIIGDNGEEEFSYPHPAVNRLAPGTEFLWTVEARSSRESIRSTPEAFSFTTTELQVFELFSPAYGENGVPTRPVFDWEPFAVEGVTYTLELVTADENGRPTSSFIQTTPPLEGPPWNSGFPELVHGQTYAWRVTATLGDISVVNQGDWSPFTVYPFTVTDFDLVSPADNSINIGSEPVFRWEAVNEATSYYVQIKTAEPEVFLPAGNVSSVSTSLDLVDVGLKLNGNTDYLWTVIAENDGVFLPSMQEFSFTTAGRNDITPCDLAEHLVVRQRLTAEEQNQLDLQGDVLDAAALIRTLDSSPPCQ